MLTDLLLQLEKKIANAVEVIELLRMQVEELEEENINLKAEQEKWKHDLISVIKRFDQIDVAPNQKPRFAVKQTVEEEEFMTV